MGIKYSKKFEFFRTRERGISLIETMIFVIIISVVLVSLVGTTATMTRQMQINYNKVYATHYAEELSDWIRVQKEVVGWNTFYSRSCAGGICNATGTSFCINNPLTFTSVYDATTLTSIGSCTYNGISTLNPSIFKRTVTFKQSGSTGNQYSIRAQIIVSWKEAGGKDFQVEVNTLYAPL
ncbi:MAG: hypothetical protein U0525_02385 [Patescibacteria group bacterium]